MLKKKSWEELVDSVYCRFSPLTPLFWAMKGIPSLVCTCIVFARRMSPDLLLLPFMACSVLSPTCLLFPATGQPALFPLHHPAMTSLLLLLRVSMVNGLS